VYLRGSEVDVPHEACGPAEAGPCGGEALRSIESRNAVRRFVSIGAPAWHICF